MSEDRFRFRIWDTEKKELIYDAENAYDYMRPCSGGKIIEADCFGDVLANKRYIVEQCTGLKDENGKLIYEGDIVRIFYDHFNGTFTEKEVVGPVNWKCGTWIVNNSLLNHSPEYDETHLKSAAVEVIGNIHENPELLEETK